MARHDYTQKLTRLQKILSLLHNANHSNGLCAKELSREFNISLRTLRRDVEAMGEAYKYHRDRIYFCGDVGGLAGDSMMREHSAIALMLLKSFAQSMEGAIKVHMLSLLESLESRAFSAPLAFSAPNSADSRADVCFTRSNLEEITLDLDSIALLQKAIKECLVIGFEFVRERGESRIYKEAQPLKILNFSGEWYMLGIESGVVKKYYLNNIAHIRTLSKGERVDENLLGKLDNALNAWFSPEQEPFMVRLWVDKAAAKYFKRKKIAPRQHLQEQADGSVEIELSITNVNELSPLVLMWIPYVVVLEPRVLRDFIADRIEAYRRILSQ